MTRISFRKLVFALTVGLAISFAPAESSSAQGTQSQVPSADEGKTRVYYVAAEPVTWNYAPSGADQVEGIRFDTSTARFPDPTSSDLARYANVKEGDYLPGQPSELDGIGPVYQKVLYRAYTDSTFTERKPRPPKWEHLGTLGPVLRAEVGDTIKVVFKNMAGRPYSVHPHGVFYEKDSEGFGYRDGTSGPDRADDAVAPGGTHTYVWPVPERAGPGPRDPSSLLWMYHSHVHEDEDINTGLMGPMIVTERGMAGPGGVPKDVDREVVAFFAKMDETDSWRYGENIRRHTDLPIDRATAQPEFEFTNLMESVNGYMYGNMPMPTLRQGERVRWYMFAGVNRSDHHTVHWHGQPATFRGRQTQVMELGPMMMGVADMVPRATGTWLLHCREEEHFKAGMSARYKVRPAERAASTGPGK
jgi:FtsP/CotA-like multicopper oxidase with cupredoxin domain